MYRQVDGVAMGSALGVTFANYYMAHIENTVISDLTVKPKLYARYVDDCFLVVEDEQHLEHVAIANVYIYSLIIYLFISCISISHLFIVY